VRCGETALLRYNGKKKKKGFGSYLGGVRQVASNSLEPRKKQGGADKSNFLSPREEKRGSGSKKCGRGVQKKEKKEGTIVVGELKRGLSSKLPYRGETTRGGADLTLKGTKNLLIPREREMGGEKKNPFRQRGVGSIIFASRLHLRRNRRGHGRRQRKKKKERGEEVEYHLETKSTIKRKKLTEGWKIVRKERRGNRGTQPSQM